jgi:hypothetical protein
MPLAWQPIRQLSRLRPACHLRGADIRRDPHGEDSTLAPPDAAGGAMSSTAY